MSVIGIDYGNLDCVISQAKRGGIDVILNGNSNRKNPNMVCFQGKQRFMGEAALSVARMHFKNNAVCIKRLIGRQYQDPEVQKEISRLAYKCVELPDGTVGVELTYDSEQKVFRCEQVTAMLLTKMKQIAASASEGAAVSYAVIAVPGYFTDIQRQAMLNATKIAGMNCLRLMNEHTAVALAYGIYKSARNLFHESEPQYVMFIDMGHSSYTVSVIAFVQGKLQVKSVAYDRTLGGRNFDEVIASYVAKKFEEKHKKNPLNQPKASLKLLAECEKAKKNLSPDGVLDTNINIECLIEELDFHGKLSLEDFEKLIEPLLNRLEGPIEAALKEAGIERSALSNVEIVGGATRVNSVKRKLSSVLGLDQEKPNMGLSTTLNADEAISRGCALQCAILSPLFKVKDFEIEDVVSHPVRVSWEQCKQTDSHMVMGDDAEEDISTGASDSMVIFPKFDSYPKTKRITFRRANTFEVTAAYDESADSIPGGISREIGKYTISGIPTTKEDEEIPRIRVNVKEDIHGIFSVASSHYMQEIEDEKPKEQDVEKSADAGNEPACDKMDTDKVEGDNEKKTTEAQPKKKRFRKIELNVEGTLMGMTPIEVESAIESELNMDQQDRIIEETNNKRNELEAYIYDMRNQIADRLRDFVTVEDRQSFEKRLQETEDWLYSDDGFTGTKSIFQNKLDELTNFGKKIEFRFSENSERQSAANMLSVIVEEYKKLANSTDEKYSHWTEEECSKIRKACEDAQTWLHEGLSKQGERKLSDDPVLVSSDINSRLNALKILCQPIINKPKPKPIPEPKKEPVEEPKEADSAPTGNDSDKTATTNNEEPSMDLD